MNYDAFSAGVEPGGLRSREEIKLLICYLLQSTGQALAKELVLDSLVSSGLANYFEAAAALEELCAAGNLRRAVREDEDAYTLTDTGVAVAETLAGALPRSVREKAVGAALRLLARIRLEKENQVVFRPLEHGLMVECHISDGENDMLCVQLRVADEMQAKLVKRRFLQDPAGFYNAAVALFTGEKQAVRELLAQMEDGRQEDFDLL